MSVSGRPVLIPQLDGLRAFAALLVVFSHTGKTGLPLIFPNLTGAFGVMLFFMLSGFLMGYLYMSKPIDTAAVSHYVAARIARIAPIYLVVVTLSYILSRLIGPQFMYYIDTGSFVRLLAFSGSNYVFWSIPPEVQFYAVFVALWFAVRTKNLQRAAPLLMLITGVMLMARPVFPGITVLSQFHIFFTGVALSVLARTPWHAMISPVAAATVQLMSVTALILASTGMLITPAVIMSIGWIDNPAFYGDYSVLLLFGGFLLASTVPNAVGNLLFANPIMRRIGNYSFSLYLFHEPIMAGTHNVLERASVPGNVQIAAAVAASLGVAALSFRFFERPVQDMLRVPIAKATGELITKLVGAADARRFNTQEDVAVVDDGQQASRANG